MPRDLLRVPDDDERALRDRALADPDAGWAEFLKIYSGSIKGLIWTYGLSREDSEEVFQDTCLRLAKDEAKLLREWDPDRCTLRGYLWVITSSVCLNFLKSRFHTYSKRKASGFVRDELSKRDVIALLQDTAPSPLERLLRQEAAQHAQTTLESWFVSAGVSEQDRRLLELRLRGLEYREISILLGISQSNAAVRYHRLRKEIEDRFPDPQA